MTKRTLLLLIMTCLLTACGSKKGTSSVKLKIIGGNTSTAGGAISLNGGILIYGKSSDGQHSFRTGIENPNVDLNLNLSRGNWEFYAIAWQDDSYGQLTGINRCSYVRADLKADEMNVGFDLAASNCLSNNGGKPFSRSDYIDSATGQFYTIKPIMCLNNTPGTGDCYSANNKSTLQNYRFIYKGDKKGDVVGNVNPLQSSCFSISNGGPVNLPVTDAGTGSPFGVSIAFYKATGCAGLPDKIVDFNDGLRGAQLADWSSVDITSGMTYLYINPGAKFNPTIIADPTSFNLVGTTSLTSGKAVETNYVHYNLSFPASAQEMCVTQEGACPAGGWIPVSSTGVFSFAGLGDNGYTLTLFLRTAAGVVSTAPLSQDVIVDRTPPVAPTLGFVSYLYSGISVNWQSTDELLFKEMKIEYCADAACADIRYTATSSNMNDNYNKPASFLSLSVGNNVCFRATAIDEFLRSTSSILCHVITTP